MSEPSSEVRYLIVRDAAGRVQFAGRGVAEYPDADEPEVREDLVAKAKAQIDAGTYVTLGKLEVTADRITQQLVDADNKAVARSTTRPSNLLDLVQSCNPHKRGVDGRCLLCSIVLLE